MASTITLEDDRTYSVHLLIWYMDDPSQEHQMPSTQSASLALVKASASSSTSVSKSGLQEQLRLKQMQHTERHSAHAIEQVR